MNKLKLVRGELVVKEVKNKEEFSHASSMANLIDDPLVERDWLTAKEFAKRIGVEYQTVYWWCSQGWVIAERIPSKTGTTGREFYRIHEEEVTRIVKFTHKNMSKLQKFVPRTLRDSDR